MAFGHSAPRVSRSERAVGHATSGRVTMAGASDQRRLGARGDSAWDGASSHGGTSAGDSDALMYNPGVGVAGDVSETDVSGEEWDEEHGGVGEAYGACGTANATTPPRRSARFLSRRAFLTRLSRESARERIFAKPRVRRVTRCNTPLTLPLASSPPLGITTQACSRKRSRCSARFAARAPPRATPPTEHAPGKNLPDPRGPRPCGRRREKAPAGSAAGREADRPRPRLDPDPNRPGKPKRERRSVSSSLGDTPRASRRAAKPRGGCTSRRVFFCSGNSR